MRSKLAPEALAAWSCRATSGTSEPGVDRGVAVGADPKVADSKDPATDLTSADPLEADPLPAKLLPAKPLPAVPLPAVPLPADPLPADLGAAGCRARDSVAACSEKGGPPRCVGGRAAARYRGAGAISSSRRWMPGGRDVRSDHRPQRARARHLERPPGQSCQEALHQLARSR